MTFTPGQAVNDRAGKRGERDEGDYLGQHGSRDAHPRAGQVQHEEGDGGELDDVAPLAHRPGRPQPPVGGPGEHRRSPVAAGVAGVGPLAHAASLPGVARGRSPPGRLWRRRAQVELPSPGRADRAGERLNSDIRPGVGSVDHHRLATLDPHVEPHVGHVRETASEEDEVAGCERRAWRYGRSRVVLRLGDNGGG